MDIIIEDGHIRKQLAIEIDALSPCLPTGISNDIVERR
jgi:hypothetical protein